MSLSKQLPTFRTDCCVSIYRSQQSKKTNNPTCTAWPSKMTTLRSFETSIIIYLQTWRHTPEEQQWRPVAPHIPQCVQASTWRCLWPPSSDMFHIHALRHSHQNMCLLHSIVLPTPRCMIYGWGCDIAALRDWTKTNSRLSSISLWQMGSALYSASFATDSPSFWSAALLLLRVLFSALSLANMTQHRW